MTPQTHLKTTSCGKSRLQQGSSMVSTVESEPLLVLLHWGILLENEDVDTQPGQTTCNGTPFVRSQADSPL